MEGCKAVRGEPWTAVESCGEAQSATERCGWTWAGRGELCADSHVSAAECRGAHWRAADAADSHRRLQRATNDEARKLMMSKNCTEKCVYFEWKY